MPFGVEAVDSVSLVTCSRSRSRELKRYLPGDLLL